MYDEKSSYIGRVEDDLLIKLQWLTFLDHPSCSPCVCVSRRSDAFAFIAMLYKCVFIDAVTSACQAYRHAVELNMLIFSRTKLAITHVRDHFGATGNARRENH